MEKIKKNRITFTIIKLLFFIVLLLLALYGLNRIMENKTSRRIKGSFFESKTNYDVIFMGTSHVYNGILPMELWQEYGIASYNWGYSNSTPAQNYYVLKEVVKRTNPKVVVIDLNGLVEYEDEGNGKYKNEGRMQSHIQFDCFPISINKIQAAYDLFDDYDHPEDFIWSFATYHNRWDEIDCSEIFSMEFSAEKGAEFLAERGETGFDPIDPNEKLANIEDYTCYPYLIKTIQFCQEKNISVLCVYLPHPMAEQSQRVANTMSSILSEYSGCEYLNLLYENVIDYFTDIYVDGGHVNYSGACKTTSYLGNFLRQNYELDDYSDNPYWIEDYEKYLEYRLSKIKEQNLLSDYLMLLKNPGFDAEIEYYDDILWYVYILSQENYYGNLTPQRGENGPEGCAAHVVLSDIDGTVVDDAYFGYCDEEYVYTRMR